MGRTDVHLAQTQRANADIELMAVSSPRAVRLRRPDRCVACGRELAVGNRAVWDPARRVVTCLECDGASYEPSDEALDAGAPGASARREYDRRHARHEERARQKLGVIGVAVARLIDEPMTTTAWKTGAAGEARVGARLEKLLEG